jgi:hypothetical protein
MQGIILGESGKSSLRIFYVLSRNFKKYPDSIRCAA